MRNNSFFTNPKSRKKQLNLEKFKKKIAMKARNSHLKQGDSGASFEPNLTKQLILKFLQFKHKFQDEKPQKVQPTKYDHMT